MKRLLQASCLAALCLPLSAFEGWQQMRVIEQTGKPLHIHAIDSDGDGREELVVVNRRQSRLDWYRWRQPEDPEPSQQAEPNALPLAREFVHQEILLDQIPINAITMPNAAGDALWVLTKPKLQLEQWVCNDRIWSQQTVIKLLRDNPQSKAPMLRVPGQPVILVAGNNGVQWVDLDTQKSRWLRPQDGTERQKWGFIDFDQDKQVDLLEMIDGDEWYPRWSTLSADSLRGPQWLSDKASADLAIARGPEPWIVASDNHLASLIRTYRFQRQEPNDFGHIRSLPFHSRNSPLTVVMTSAGPGALLLESSQPKMWFHRLGQDGWTEGHSFPIPSGITDIQYADTNTVWLRSKDKVFTSNWDGKRWSFPTADITTEEETLLGMGVIADIAWSLWSNGTDLVLKKIQKGEWSSETWPQLAQKASEGRWLGGRKLLIKDRFSKHLRFLNGAAEHSKTLADSSIQMDQYYILGPQAQVYRLHEGVLQIIDEQLQARDQIMLDDGVRIMEVSWWKGQLIALENGGTVLHTLSPNEAGIYTSVQIDEIPYMRWLHLTPHVGFMGINYDGIAILSPGAQAGLELVDTIDARSGRQQRKGDGIDRLFTIDVDKDGTDELLTIDDVHHELHLWQRGGTSWELSFSWQAFTDRSYPYGYQEERSKHGQPRNFLAFDGNGDDKIDLAMLAHDRLIIYLAHGSEEENDQ